MRILLVISNGYVCGGAEQSVRLLKRALKKRGHEVCVVASDLGAADPSTFSDVTYPHTRRGVFGYYRRLWNPASYRAVKQAVADFRPDVVHFHTMGELSPSAIFAARNSKAMLTVHGPEEYTKALLPWFLESNAYKGKRRDWHRLTMFGRLEYVFYRFIQRPLYVGAFRGHLSLMVSPSAYLLEVIHKEDYGVKAVHVPNGFALARPQSLPQNNTVCFVGRLSYVKGADQLLRAVALAQKSVPKIRLMIVGDGPERQRLETLADELKLGKSVTFYGWKSQVEVRSLMAAAQIVVIPSVWPENLPTVCVEAMALGRPVIGTATGGIPEMIDGGETGYIVPPADPVQLAGAIVNILSDKTLAQRMSAAAVVRAKHYSEDAFIEAILRQYETACQSTVQ